MIPIEITRIKNILDEILGSPKQDIDDTLQLEYPCPSCIEKYGQGEIAKYNLSISLRRMIFNCWKCSAECDSNMKGNVRKLIKTYGNQNHLREFDENIKSLKESRLYDMFFDKDDIILDNEKITLPNGFKSFSEHNNDKALKYLTDRGVGRDIIEKYDIGFIGEDTDKRILSNRIVIPSYDKCCELNYWTGRDYTGIKKRQKYYNPKVERKNIIFNENKVEWDADITLVEGPFDHIVVPNSIPLLGKVLNDEFYLLWQIRKMASSNVNIFLDGDAYESVKTLYKTLNSDRLYGKIRYIPVDNELDPSKIYEIGGRKLILEHMSKSTKIRESLL